MKKIEKIFTLVIILRIITSLIFVPETIKILPMFFMGDITDWLLLNIAGGGWIILNLFSLTCLIIGLLLIFKQKSFRINRLLGFGIYFYSILYFAYGSINVFTKDKLFLSDITSLNNLTFFLDYIVTLTFVIVSILYFRKREPFTLNKNCIDVSNKIGLRFINFCIDIFVIIYFSFSIQVRIAQNTEIITDRSLFLLLTGLFYYLFSEFIFTQTIGKLITRTRVYTYQPSYFQVVLIRTITRLIPFEPLSHFGKSKGGWHDRLSKSILIRTSDKNNCEVDSSSNR